jgi:CubicO group peptidase (beta-lactamase class C family)
MPVDRSLTLRNWFEPPHNRRGFQRVREVVPTARIARDSRDPSPMPSEPMALDALRFNLTDGASVALTDYLEGSCTDGFIVVLGGVVVYEKYWNGLRPATMHLLHSVSKSYCAALAGVLVGRGLLAADDTIVDLVPDLRGTSFDGATVRHLLDMRAGTHCPEDYDPSDTDAPSRIYSLEAGYEPLDGFRPVGILGHMRRLTNARPHGGLFEYRSVLANVLARVLETVADTPYPELLARELWAPLAPEYDAEIMLDPFGFPPVEGGMCCTLRDLVRLGEAYRNEGRVTGTSVIPAPWLRDTLHGDEDAIAAYASSDPDAQATLPVIMYRNGWWIVRRDRVCAALGIYGQMVYVDRDHQLTVARLASEPTPLNPEGLATLIRAAEAIVAAGLAFQVS